MIDAVFGVFTGWQCTWFGIVSLCALWGIVSCLISFFDGHYKIYRAEIEIKHPDNPNKIRNFFIIEWVAGAMTAFSFALIAKLVKYILY